LIRFFFLRKQHCRRKNSFHYTFQRDCITRFFNTDFSFSSKNPTWSSDN
jgi:hypothetical protein